MTDSHDSARGGGGPDHGRHSSDSTLSAGVALRHWSAVGAIAGLCFFGLLAAMYDEFYTEFGITSTDVELSYSDTLTRSWGFIIAVAVALAVGISVVLWIWKRILKRKHGKDCKIDQLPVPAYLTALAAIFAILICAGLVGENFMEAAGKRGAAGQPVTGLRLGLLFFDVRAQPVAEIVSVASSPVTIPTRGLTFLGKSGRSFVLYCTVDGQILRLSMERFTLRTSTHQALRESGSRDCGTAVTRNVPK
jgi:predicted heme/steroid binding protein